MDGLPVSRYIGLELAFSFFDCPEKELAPSLSGRSSHLLLVSCVACCSDQQSTELASKEVFIGSEFPSDFLGGVCNKLQSEIPQPNGNTFVLCKYRSDVCQRTSDLGPHTAIVSVNPQVSVAYSRMIWLIMEVLDQGQ